MILFLLIAVCFADDSLFWGQYRPNLLFGMRPNVPESLINGLSWFNSATINGITKVRHETENIPEIKKLAHSAYDVRLGGRQIIQDQGNALTLLTDLVKSEDGLAWELRITGKQHKDSIQSIIFYTGIEGHETKSDSSIQISKETKKNLSNKGISGDIEILGSDPTLGGKFRMVITEGEGEKPEHDHEHYDNKPPSNSFYAGLTVPTEMMWQMRKIYATMLQKEVQQFIEEYGDSSLDIPVYSIFSLNNQYKEGANVHLVQKTFQGDFSFNIKFHPADSLADKKKYAEFFDQPFKQRFTNLMLKQEDKFNNAYTLNKPFNEMMYHTFANELLSSVSGGIGFFHGDSVIDSDYGIAQSQPRSLFSGTPSRTFFPRGFYWDQGFTALSLKDYDPDLVLDMLVSWMDTMDDDGWIEREQILGDEGRSRVPEEFQVQSPEIANPPTLIMALSHLEFTPKQKKVLKKLYPKLRQHFDWFVTTQKGEIELYDREFHSDEVYRWRGKSAEHIFASGFDDYPRAPDISDGEIHVDLMSWVGASANSMAKIAEYLGKDEEAEMYMRIMNGVKTNLANNHWSDEYKSFCDIGVDDFEEDKHECHVGYVTLLPFALKLVEEDDAHLVDILEQIRDPEQLWSEYGIRSLSKSDEFFGTGENYWRGSIWVNVNYLILDALKHYSRPESIASFEVKTLSAEIYNELRRNLVDNVYKHWLKTNTVWESYDGLTGAQRGAKCFTGWTALTANIMFGEEITVTEPVEEVQEDEVTEKTEESEQSEETEETEESTESAESEESTTDDDSEKADIESVEEEIEEEIEHEDL